jgi:fengycin family lipopeptide synthetase D
LLTAEKFVDNPYRAGEILYKSGDLVRLTAAGEMAYLGRIDHQVKIRGFRIELAEIEGQLLKYAAVKEAVVISQIDEEAERHLYAYIVPHSPDSASTGSPDLNTGELRAHLSQRLPDFMIPSYFILLEKMPLTVNGKVDKKVLNSMGTRLDSAVEYTPPATEAEKIVAGVWQEVLQLDKVGVHDKFFDLGGTSLDVVKVTGRLKEIFKKDVPVIRMFLYPTIHSLAAYLRQGGENPADLGRGGTEGMNIRSDVEIDTSADLMQEAMQVLGQDDDE